MNIRKKSDDDSKNKDFVRKNHKKKNESDNWKNDSQKEVPKIKRNLDNN